MSSIPPFLRTSQIAEDWRSILEFCLSHMDQTYLTEWLKHHDWLPGPQHLFNAFSLPRAQTKFILFGESPYPRVKSANGYAFWDAATNQIWSETGFDKTVNRATSLRNFLKMLLVTEGLLDETNTSQPAIASIEKQLLIPTTDLLFQRMQEQGFLLLNASLVLGEPNVRYHAKHWQPFMQTLLGCLQDEHASQPTLVLWGKIAHWVTQLPESKAFAQLISEHPYNISFIQNKVMQTFFKPFHLLCVTSSV